VSCGKTRSVASAGHVGCTTWIEELGGNLDCRGQPFREIVEGLVTKRRYIMRERDRRRESR
jgi:hypothetical protein